MENQITQKELAAIFPDGVPMPVMKMIFPEKSEKLKVEDIRYILNAMRNRIALSAGAEPVAYGVFNKYGDLLYLSASKEAADLIKKWEGDSIKPLYEEPVKIESAVAGWKPPQACDGKEQLAFEAWAVSQRYDMHEHPLHYIFMDPKTSAARMGWNAALKYVRDQFAASPTSSQGDAE